ncbi:MAG: PRC-barrel domain-containing protein [Steroidobacteraceae bacterium]|jgi:uncharacterized protein YrrD
MTSVTGHPEAIHARKVNGTNAKETTGYKIGQIDDIVLDNLSNNIVFTIVSCGGFLGMGEKHHPIPSSSLDFDEHAGASCR